MVLGLRCHLNPRYPPVTSPQVSKEKGTGCWQSNRDMTLVLCYSSPCEGNVAGAFSPRVTPARCCHGAHRKGSWHTHREQSSLEQNAALNQLLCCGFPPPLRQLRVSMWQLPPVSPCLERSLLFPSGPVLCCCSPSPWIIPGLTSDFKRPKTYRWNYLSCRKSETIFCTSYETVT